MLNAQLRASKFPYSYQNNYPNLALFLSQRYKGKLGDFSVNIKNIHFGSFKVLQVLFKNLHILEFQIKTF